MRGLAHAKINLTLEVLGKRPDGYHEIVSIMQTISLADSLELQPAADLRLDCDVAALAGDDNLVLRAARLLGKPGHFTLRKRIPTAAGLGGGSSDAALALRLLDAAYNLGLSREQLLAAAAQLGSDVPFFLHAGTALAEGRGERVTPLPDLPEQWLVLLNPGVPLSTAAVYGELRPEQYADGKVTLQWAQGEQPSPAAAGEGRVRVPPLLNMLEAPALRLAPAITACRQRLIAAGAARVLLCGSGPTVFGLADTEAQAQEIAASTAGIAARFVGRDEAFRLAV